MSHSPDSDEGAASPQFHEPAPSPMAAAAPAPVTATAEAAASGAAASASRSALTDSERPVVRVHGLEQAEADSGAAPPSTSATHMAADSSAAPVMPAPSPAAVANGSSSSGAFGRSDEGTLGPAPGPSIVVEANAVQQPLLSTATAPIIDPSAASAASAASGSASAPASLPNGLYSASNGSASSASSSSSAISTASNPSAPALAAALWPLVAQVRANTDAAVVPSLDSVLAVIQSLPFEARANLCSAAASAAPSFSSSSSAAASTAVFDATLNYFLDDQHSGSAHDGLCKFLYELYWEASTKLGHEPVVSAERNNNTVVAAASATPPAHLFLLNFLPVLIFKFVQKHFDAGSATSAGSAAGSASSSYAGLFTVFLAVYNTERILAARSGNGGILAPKPAPTAATIPELEGVVPFAAPAVAASTGVAKPASATAAAPPSVAQAKPVLPAINEPTTVHVMLLLHVLLLKHQSVFSQLLPQSRESLVLLAGLATTSGLLGSADPFADVARIAASDAQHHALHHHKHHSAAAGSIAPVQTLQPQQPSAPVRWNHAWVASAGAAGMTPVRYLLTSSLLQDFLFGIEFVLAQSRSAESAALAQSRSSENAASFREWSLIALRQVHCRALEEMMPEILLQTTCMLQQEEEDRQRQ